MRPRHSPRALFLPLLTAVVTVLAVLIGTGFSADAAPKSRITICHATSSRTNPYVEITVAPESIFKQGHDVHQDGRDIIPPFEYLDAKGVVQSYPGKNWNVGGEEILAAGCTPLYAPEPLDQGEAADVTICHRVASPEYVRVHVSWRDAISSHADDHPLDIIPPFSYTRSGGDVARFAGQNWDEEGIAIFDLGCVVPEGTPGAVADDPVGVSVSCVQPNADGTYDAVFGYDNPNGHDVSLPIGATNTVYLSPGSAGSAGRGQPTTFGTQRIAAAFTVRDVPRDQAVTWRVAHEGTVEATAGISFPVRCEAPAPVPEGPPVDPVPPPADISPLADSVGVFVECVGVNPAKGTYSATFGYINPGTETIRIPVGEANRVTGLGHAFTDQPTTLVPGSVVAFTIDDIPLARTPTWSLSAVGGREVSASPSAADRACAVQPDEVVKPDLTTEVTPPGGPVDPGRPTTYEIETGNEGPDPAVGVVIVIPPPAPGDEITDVTPTDGVSCSLPKHGVHAGGAVCRTPVILPGEHPAVTVRTEPPGGAPLMIKATATARSVSGVRVRAADTDRVRRVRRTPPVTG